MPPEAAQPRRSGALEAALDVTDDAADLLRGRRKSGAACAGARRRGRAGTRRRGRSLSFSSVRAGRRLSVASGARDFPRPRPCAAVACPRPDGDRTRRAYRGPHRTPGLPCTGHAAQGLGRQARRPAPPARQPAHQPVCGLLRAAAAGNGAAKFLGVVPIAALPLATAALPAGFRDQVLRVAIRNSPAAAHRAAHCPACLHVRARTASPSPSIRSKRSGGGTRGRCMSARRRARRPQSRSPSSWWPRLRTTPRRSAPRRASSQERDRRCGPSCRQDGSARGRQSIKA